VFPGDRDATGPVLRSGRSILAEPSEPLRAEDAGRQTDPNRKTGSPAAKSSVAPLRSGLRQSRARRASGRIRNPSCEPCVLRRLSSTDEVVRGPLHREMSVRPKSLPPRGDSGSGQYVDRDTGCLLWDQPEQPLYLADGTGDPRREFMERLRAVLGQTGSISVCNAAFEKGVLTRCAALLPEFGPWVFSVKRRIVDLMPNRGFKAVENPVFQSTRVPKQSKLTQRARMIKTTRALAYIWL